MTLLEFASRFEREAPKYKWVLLNGVALRAKRGRTTKCPLEVLGGVPDGEPFVGAKRIGLSEPQGSVVMDAADSVPRRSGSRNAKMLRRRMLAAVGLQESSETTAAF